MEDELAQNDEISVIHSIYEEAHLFTYSTAKKTGSFFVKISSPITSKLFKLKFENENLTAELEHLTPILIDFKFPITYPSVDPPEFKLSCRWLSYSNLSRLCQKLDELWIENDHQCVLFTWISFLSDEVFDYLNIDTNNILIINEAQELDITKDKRTFRPSCSYLLLKDYDKDQIDLRFRTTYFSCKVCFSDKLGKDCIKFNGCDHVFCNECMKGYFESQIQSGDVNKLNCPFEKCESQALQTQVI